MAERTSPSRGGRAFALLRRAGSEAGSLLAIATLLTVVFAVARGAPRSAWPAWFAVMLIATLSFGLTISALYELVFPPLRRRVRSLAGGAAVHVVLVVGGSLLATEICVRLLALLSISIPRSSLLPVGLGVSIVAVALHVFTQRLRERAREAELRSRLEALQARTNPHFLFNSLNTLAGLIREDPERAERLVERLSGVFRHALERADAEWIRLGEELDAVRDQLEVESIRLDGRLTAELRCDEHAEQALVPPMLVQPLVENAVLHGVASRPEGGRVLVSVSREPERLRVVVEDDGPGPGGSRHRGSGLALRTLRERLELIYGGRARLELETAGDGSGCRATLELPAAGRETA